MVIRSSSVLLYFKCFSETCLFLSSLLSPLYPARCLWCARGGCGRMDASLWKDPHKLSTTERIYRRIQPDFQNSDKPICKLTKQKSTRFENCVINSIVPFLSLGTFSVLSEDEYYSCQSQARGRRRRHCGRPHSYGPPPIRCPEGGGSQTLREKAKD